jgi:hypothetical protein
MRIIIGGDVCPINSNSPLFHKNNDKLFGDLQQFFDSADMSIVNLEVPLTDKSTKIIKSGENIKGTPETASALKKSGIKAVSLANNHMGDYGEDGVIDTLRHCQSAGLDCFGAGENLSEASKPYLFKGELTIGVLSYSDIEFGIAKPGRAGANPLDLKQLTLDVLKVKSDTDYCIVILHEGKEHYAYPSPELQKICHFICELGADLVVCQHSHISGAWEKFKNSDIIYGQGNLLFDYANRKSESWTNGYLISVELSGTTKALELIPFRQTLPGIEPLNAEEMELFREKMELLSKNTSNPDFIASNWIQFIQRFEKTYFSTFRGHGRVQRKIFSYLPFVKFIYPSKKKAILLNVIRSRVHREAIIDLLEENK